MTAPAPGDAFYLDLEGMVIAGRYIDVDPPHRLLVEWDRQGTDQAMPSSVFVEITLTQAVGGTKVKVQFSGLSAKDAAFHRQLWARHLDRIADAFTGVEPGPHPGN